MDLVVSRSRSSEPCRMVKFQNTNLVAARQTLFPFNFCFDFYTHTRSPRNRYSFFQIRPCSIRLEPCLFLFLLLFPLLLRRRRRRNLIHVHICHAVVALPRADPAVLATRIGCVCLICCSVRKMLSKKSNIEEKQHIKKADMQKTLTCTSVNKSRTISSPCAPANDERLARSKS